MNILLVTSLKQLIHLSAPYATLLHSIGGMAAHYYSIASIHASIQAFGALGASLFFILVTNGHQFVAALPFQRQKNKARGLVSTLSFWGDLDIYAHNVHQQLLVEGYRPDALDLAASFLKTECRGMWDSIDLRRVPCGDENLRHFLSRFDTVRMESSGEKAYVLDRRATLRDFLDKRKINNIQLCRRNLERECGPYELQLRDCIDPGTYDEIKHIHIGRQDFKIGHGVHRNSFFTDRLEERYIRRLLTLWSDAEALRCYRLVVGSHAIAVAIFHHSDDASYVFLTAMDSSYKRYQPGRILWYLAFSEEIERFGVRRIALGWGSSKFKEDFASGANELANITVIAPQWRSRAVLALAEWIGFVASGRRHSHRMK